MTVELVACQAAHNTVSELAKFCLSYQCSDGPFELHFPFNKKTYVTKTHILGRG